MNRLLTVRISVRSILITLGLLVGVYAAHRLVNFLVMLLISVIVAAALLPAVTYFEKRFHWHRFASVLAVFALILAVLVLLGVVVAPTLFEQTRTLAHDLPRYTASARGTYAWAHTLQNRYPWLPDLDDLTQRLSDFVSERLGEGIAWATRLLEAFFELFIILIVTFFLLLDGPELKYGWLLLIAPPQRARFEALIDPIALKLGGYVQGIMISIGALAGFLAVGLSIVHEPLALALALLSGLLAIIPLVGGYLGLIPALLLAFTVSWHLAVVVWIIYYIGNTIVGHFIIPFVFARSVAVSPLLIMLALLVGAELDGVAGALIAVPVLAALIVLVRNFHVTPQEAAFRRPEPVDVKHREPLRLRLKWPD